MKWSICYNGKNYLQVYGKKKAYTLLYQLSLCLLGLSVNPVEMKQRDKSKRKGEGDINEYHRIWRDNNREKIRAYQKEYRLKKKKPDGVVPRSYV